MAKARGVLRLVPRALVGRFRYPREGVHIRQPRCADQDAVSILGRDHSLADMRRIGDIEPDHLPEAPAQKPDDAPASGAQ
jgi:hypothetical protein